MVALVILESGSYAGAFITVTHTLNSDTSGIISIDGQLINYTGTDYAYRFSVSNQSRI